MNAFKNSIIHISFKILITIIIKQIIIVKIKYKYTLNVNAFEESLSSLSLILSLLYKYLKYNILKKRKIETPINSLYFII